MALPALLLMNPGELRADHVILDDCIIDGSLAVGLDAVNGENFGFDTIRIKENNLRFHFDDTSVSASFPRNDWRFIANDSANGGESYLAIEDVTGGRIPFRVRAGAGNHALYIDSQGDVGLGTNNPILELHIVDGDTPTVRLEQDGSNGWNPQTWDVAGNETNFFIRDVTNGSKLPFRIRPDAPSNSLEIEADGALTIPHSITLGTTAAEVRLTLPDAGNDMDYPAMRIGEAFFSSGTGLAHMSNNNWYNGTGWSANNEDRVGSLIQLNNDLIRFFRSPAGVGVPTFVQTAELDASGNWDILGTVGTLSDRNAKDDIVEVDTADVLDRLAELPISTWRYKQEENISHMGPMAQDFWAAFQLGKGETRICPSDTAAVAMAAAKELNKRLEAKQEEIAELKKHNADLEERLRRIEEALKVGGDEVAEAEVQ